MKHVLSCMVVILLLASSASAMSPTQKAVDIERMRILELTPDEDRIELLEKWNREDQVRDGRNRVEKIPQASHIPTDEEMFGEPGIEEFFTPEEILELFPNHSIK